jgi:hypothetical protein
LGVIDGAGHQPEPGLNDAVIVSGSTLSTWEGRHLLVERREHDLPNGKCRMRIDQL